MKVNGVNWSAATVYHFNTTATREIVTMRQQSTIQVRVRGAVIGGPDALICLPLMAKSGDDLFRQAEELSCLLPDVLEWRVDAFDQVADIGETLLVLRQLRQIIGNLPLIFTCRIDREGGLTSIPQDLRLALITSAIGSGMIDLVDIELCNDRRFLETVRNQATLHDCRLILSSHNFQDTPAEPCIINTLVEAQTAGADIAKLAVMPRKYSDVLTLLTATDKARNGAVDIPMVTMAMGKMGRISRMAGGLFGSDITFASGRQVSAPGQMPIDELRTGIALLSGS